MRNAVPCIARYDCIQIIREDSKQFYDIMWALKGKGSVKMPWEKKTVEKSRIEFVSEAMRGETSISELCRKYAITRKTGYKWIERFQNGENLSDKSHAPFHIPNKTPHVMEDLVLQLRRFNFRPPQAGCLSRNCKTRYSIT